MISDVDYFHMSAVSVAYLFLYKQKDFLKIFSFSGRLRRRQRRWHRPWRRDVINSHGHFHLRKATSCYDLARHIKTPSETLLEGIGKPHPRPIYGSLPPAGGSQRGRFYAQQDCMVEPALQWTFSPTRLSGQGNRCMSVMSSLGKWRWMLQTGTSVGKGKQWMCYFLSIFILAELLTNWQGLMQLYLNYSYYELKNLTF